MVCQKFRIRFRKAGALRLISHHDLMRSFERMLRRAAIPFHSTAGFNPKPRLIFALSLPLGIVGCREVVDLELDAQLSPAELIARLAQQAPEGLTILSAEQIDPKSTAHVRQVTYRVALPSERCADLPERVRSVLAASCCWFERNRPKKRRLNLRAWISDIRVQSNVLELDLSVTPDGTARPAEVLQVLGLGDLDGRLLFERTALELNEEQSIPRPIEKAPGRSGATLCRVPG
jgi:radical SAM-linked protein